MRTVRLFVTIVIVLSLIVVTVAPASAGKDKPTKEKPTKVVHKEPPGQGKKETPQATHTPRPDDDPDARVVICHKPGTPAEKTLTVPQSAVPGHLGHGDTLGPCPEATPTPTATATVPITPTAIPSDTMTICHKPGTPAEKTLTLPLPAIPGHLRHGDTLGPCPEATPTPTATATVPITPTAIPSNKMTICHKPGTPAEKTLTLPLPAIPGHLGHGDTLGPCPEATPTPTATATVSITPTAIPSNTMTICHKPGTPATGGHPPVVVDGLSSVQAQFHVPAGRDQPIPD